MAQTVVDLTLGTIRDLLVEEVKFLSGVRDQVEDVQNELQIMQSFLEEVDRMKSDQNPLALTFVRQIRSLCYRVEDVVETYATEVVLRKRRKGIKNILKRIACSLCECKSIHEVGTEIAGIKKEISRLTASMETHGIIKTTLLGRQKSNEDDARKRLLRQKFEFPVENDFVGMKKDIDTLVGELLYGEVSYNRVVSICGMGGMGKTTLAQKIYHHNDIRRRFEAFAWVCISKDYKPKDILHDLLGQLIRSKREEAKDKEENELVQLIRSKREEAKGMEENELVREVHKVLEENKCLIVLDDIWELNDWKCLQPAFALEEATSKALITTRKENVAKVGFFHRLGFLTEDEAWELLQKKAFIRSDGKGDLGMESKTLERIGREMVSKCGYLPLAISVLGGILIEKKSVDEWDSLNKKINVNMRAEGSDEKEIERVLSLSYDDLPYRLKPCFLYLSRFQENESIAVRHVCLLWIVEGLVSPNDQEKDETLRDVALRYLRELASRSLVQLQEGEFFLSGEEFNAYRVHDLLRDLCLAKSKEEEFLSVMDFQPGKGPPINPSSTTSCLRRLVIRADEKLDGVSLTKESFQSLRSLSLHDAPSFLFTGAKRVIDFSKLKCLRVLTFDDVRFEGELLPTEISKLINLKSLSFSRCVLKDLPPWVGDLPFLQVLHLDLSDGTKIPNVLWKIKGLKSLMLPVDFVAEEKLVLDGLNELETLYDWNSKTCELTDLSKLQNLRLILTRIYGNENLYKFVDIIERTRVMNTIVSVHNCDFGSEEGMALFKKVFKSSKIHILILEESCVNICKLPDYEPGFFPNLSGLSLEGGNISEDPMGTLEKLPNLRKLSLWGFFVGKEMTCHANGFPQLRHLQLQRLKYLEEWRVEEGAMPCLSHLEITDCNRLVMIPDGIKSIITLHTLNIGGMPQHFKDRVEEGGEDFEKVCHVNSIIITEMRD